MSQSFAAKETNHCPALLFDIIWIHQCILYFLLMRHIYLMPIICLNVFIFVFYALRTSRIRVQISLIFKKQKMNKCASLVT